MAKPLSSEGLVFFMQLLKRLDYNRLRQIGNFLLPFAL